MTNKKSTSKVRNSILKDKSLIVIAVAVFTVAGIGTYLLNNSQAAKPNSTASGSIVLNSTGDLSTPFSVNFKYSKSSSQLERPFIQFECYRDVDGDGLINNKPFTNSKDLVYAFQSYLLGSWHHPDYPVSIVSDGKLGLAGTASANLLSGSSQLVSIPGDAQCQASLQEWDANIRQQTYPIIYATTPLISLDDPRITN